MRAACRPRPPTCTCSTALNSAPASLKQRVLRAGGWLLTGYALGQVLRLASNLVMTRLLEPDMFGVMAIATMVLMMLMLLSDLGLRQSVVQSRQGDDPAFLDTAWSLQIVRGFTLWVVALALGGALWAANHWGLFAAHSVYAAPELAPVIAVSGLTCAINGFQSMRVATAFRNLEQRRLVEIELASQFAALLFMVPVALATRSVWALVGGGLVANLVGTALSHAWMRGRRGRLRWEPRALGELMNFGKWIFASSALYVLAVYGDRLLLGALVDTDTLGLYAIALLIVGAVDMALGRLTQTVSLPALAEIARDNPSKLREVYYKLRTPGDLALLFLLGLLFLAGQEVIDLLYDPRYAAAGPMLEVLALSLFTSRYGVANQIYVALGTPRAQAIVNAVRCAALYILLAVLFWLGGLRVALWGIALHGLATLPMVFWFNARLGLNDWRREALLLGALPVGLACGAAWSLIAARV